MGQILWPDVGFVLLVVIQLVPSQLEDDISEAQFTIPDVRKGFSDAVAWCKTNYNSTLAVVNDSNTQTALTQFLTSSDWSSSMFYIDIRLLQEQENTWFLINGIKYGGGIRNQDPQGSTVHYWLYCRLKHDGSNFIVEASAPSDLRRYMCDYEENRCSSDSSNSIVYNGRCYVKYENERLTWCQARQRCINGGGDLAQFQNTRNNYSPPFNTSWLNTSLIYWVGIRWKNWSWKYSETGQESIFTSWSRGQPNNYSHECVCVASNGNTSWSWNDSDCTTERQFVCMKRVAVHMTTMKPKTTVTSMTTRKNPVTGLNVTVDNKPTSVEDQTDDGRTIGLAVGIGGGGLILIIASIAVLIIITKRRKGRRNTGIDSGSDGDGSGGGDIGKIQHDVYAAVVPSGKYQGINPESSSEIIYTAPVFKNDPTNNSAPDKSIYKEVNSVRSPDNSMASTLRGQTRSLYPQGDSYLNANATEVSEATG